MSETSRHLEDVQKQIKVDDLVLGEARRRRKEVLRVCGSFRGVLGTFGSGSVAMGVANNDPHLDADGGMTLDRRCYPALGPDGGGDTPVEVVGDLHDHLGPSIRETWPEATIHDMKRGVTVRMHELFLGQDPFVDVVVAMNRRDGAGLWIPNMDAKRWDASDPQRHVQLMITGSRTLRRTRARVVRLAKAWNKQFSAPALSSFNIVALALEAITEPEAIDKALLRFFDHAAAVISVRRTDDPANVSGPIKLEVPKATAVARLESARDHLAAAIDHDTDPQVVSAELHAVFWNYLPEPIASASRGEIAQMLRTGSPRLRETASGIAVVGALTNKRSFGGARA